MCHKLPADKLSPIETVRAIAQSDRKTYGERLKEAADKLVQEGRSQEAEGRRRESLYSKLFNLFQLDSYFCHAPLVVFIRLPVVLKSLQYPVRRGEFARFQCSHQKINKKSDAYQIP